MRASSCIAVLALSCVAASAQEPNAVTQRGVVGVLVAGQTPPRDNAQPARPGTATLRGHVFAGDTGQPLRRAQVRIRSNSPIMPGQQPENRLATTDINGRYEFKDVRAGRYSLSVSKPGGYMDVQYGQRRPLEPGRPLDVLDGQTIEKIDFSLPRGGVITGRIVDEAGDPVTDAQVGAMRPQTIGGVRRMVSAGRTVTTNDIGEFRLFALPPGDYYITATLRNSDMRADTDNRSGYAPTYYPGTPDIGSAQRVSVALGQTITDLSLPLIAAPTARVTGVALDSQNQPVRGTVMAIARSEWFGLPTGGAGPIRPDGSFTINSLPPGDYTLQVQGRAPGGGPGGPGVQVEPEYASADITVSGADLTGIRLTSVRPSIVSGRVIVGSGDPASLRTSTLRIGAPPIPAGGLMPAPTPAPVAANDDGTFQTKARPGQARIVIQGLTAPWGVKAVRYRGADVTDGGIEVRAGENLDDVEIELTNRNTDLSGLVTNSRGEPVKDYWVVLFARDPAKRRPPTRYVRTARADQDGRFKAIGLPPAEYFAFALEVLDPNGETTDPDVLDRIEGHATRFTLNEGETKTLDLRLSTLP